MADDRIDIKVDVAKAETNVRTAIVLYAAARHAGFGDKEVNFALDRVMGSLRSDPNLMMNAANNDLSGLATKMQEALSYAQDNPKAVNLYAAQVGDRSGNLGLLGSDMLLSRYGLLRGGRAAVGAREDNGDSGTEGRAVSSFARNSTLAGFTNSPDEVSFRNSARSTGLWWIADNPDLTRQFMSAGVGRDGLQAMADAHFTQRNYERLRDDVHFTAKDTANLANYINTKHLDREKTISSMADVARAIANAPDDRKRWEEAVKAHIDKPNDAEAEKKLHDTMKYLKEKYPQLAPKVDAAQTEMKLGNQSEAVEAQRNASVSLQEKGITNELNALRGTVNQDTVIAPAKNEGGMPAKDAGSGAVRQNTIAGAQKDKASKLTPLTAKPS
jgi:hypothetical protein